MAGDRVLLGAEEGTRPPVISCHAAEQVVQESGLAHRRAAREDDQVRAVQTAKHAVEIFEIGGEAGNVGVALVSGSGVFDRCGERLGEGREATARGAALRERKQRAFRFFDNVAGVVILLEAMRAFGLDEVEVSEHDILYGAAIERAAAG